MNTHDSSATARARIGLVELPELAGMLQNAGLHTITGPNFREAATEIKEGFKESTFPIIVADASTPGLRAWTQRIQSTAASAGKPVHIAVVREGGDPVIVSEDIIELRTPISLNEVLAAVKMAPVPGGDARYPAPVAAPEPAGMDFDFDFDAVIEDEAAPAAQQVTAAPAALWEAPVQEAATEPAEALPWEAPAAPWEAPVQEAAPAAAVPAEEFGWDTPATAPAPAPSAPAAQDEEFSWGDPAPARTAATAPAAEFEWNESVTAAPAATDEPAAAKPDTNDWDAALPAAPKADVAWGSTSAPEVPEAPATETSGEWDDAFPVTAPAIEWGTPAPTPVAAAPVVEPADIPWNAPAAPAVTAVEADLIDWGTPAAAPAAPVASAPAVEADLIDWGTPAAPVAPATATIDWAAPVASAPVVEADLIDWGTPAAAAAPVAPATATIDWAAPAPAPVVEPATIDWGTPAAAPVPETDRPEPRTEQRAFTPAPPAAAQAHVPAPVAPVRLVQEQSNVSYLEPVQRTGRYAAPAPAPRQQASYRQQPAGPQGELIVSYSGKGGVGKSTTSISLASLAADAGMKVILIDGNAAQGDLRTYMKLHRSNLPTIYDAALGDVTKAVLHPDVINENREQNLGRVNFAFVAAAPDEIYDQHIVTDEVYGQVIDYARRHADLVILDTQIVEAADRSGVVDDIILPSLVQDGWGLGISDMSSPGVNNLNHRLHKFIRDGVPTERLMVLLNRVPENQLPAAAKASEYFKGRAKFLGVIEDDFQISRDMNAGRMKVENRNLNAALNTALYAITGNEAFTRVIEEEETDKPGIFRRLLKRNAA